MLVALQNPSSDELNSFLMRIKELGPRNYLSETIRDDLTQLDAVE